MATIKIDRGFTQRISQKGALNTPTPMPPLTPPPPKKPQGWQKWMTFAVIGGVVLLTVIAISFFVPKGHKKAPVDAKSVQPVIAAPQPVATEPDADKPGKPSEEDVPSEMKMATVPESQPAKPVQQPARPVVRDVPLGSVQGLLCEYYEHIPEKQIKNLRSAGTFPNQPSRTVQIGRFELSENVGDNYGVRVRGYLVAPQSGKYTFEVCVDDAAELWLSSDDTPANMRKIVTVNSWVTGWGLRGDQKSEACELLSGQRYYLEALMKEGTGLDKLAVGWSGPVSDKTVVIEARFLQPWSDVSTPEPDVAAEKKKSIDEREALIAPAQAAVSEQQRVNGSVYRYVEAAQVLKEGKASWHDPEARALIETAILRYELLGRLRTFVQTELTHAAVKGVWVAFGGQADVTNASDEGVTVAPGRIVAWAKVPPDQMLRLVTATVSRSTADTNTKSLLFLAAAVFCKEISGGVDLALKFRERAVSINSTLLSLSDRVLGGAPDAILAQSRIQAIRPELARLATAAALLAEKNAQCQRGLSSVTGLVSGLNVEYWENVRCGSLNEVRKQGVLSTAPATVQHIRDFATPEDHSESFVARVRGYITPPETGDFFFYISADDQGEFWLSADDTPLNLTLCVKTDSYSKPRTWDKANRKSKPVSLVKGRHYYLEALLREGAKDDHLAVAWSPLADDDPQLVTSPFLLRAATAGFTPRAQEIRKKLEDDLKTLEAQTTEIITLHKTVETQARSTDQVPTEMAAELQKQAARAKDTLREAERLLLRIDAAGSQLKAAIRTEGDQS